MVGIMESELTKISPHELAFDIDGVVADTFRALVDTAESEYGVELQYDAFTDYNFLSVLDIEEDIFNKIIERVLDDPLGMGIKPMSGAVEVLTRLMDLGPLTLVTARPDNGAIQEWLQEHFHLNGRNGIRLNETGTHTEKLPVLRKYGIKYFVEDRLATCYLVQEASLTPIVFEQPWNQRPHPFHTVRNWEDISAIIKWE